MKVVVTYGSETGCAEAIAQDLFSAFRKLFTGLNLDLCELDNLSDHCGKYLVDSSEASPVGSEKLCIIAVVSTTGDGEPPMNAEAGYNWLKKLDKAFCDTQFCVLALGDSSYSNFCACGKFFDAKFAERGALRFLPLALADDSISLEETVEPWVETVTQKLSTLLAAPAPVKEGLPALPMENPSATCSTGFWSESWTVEGMHARSKTAASVLPPFSVEIEAASATKVSFLGPSVLPSHLSSIPKDAVRFEASVCSSEVVSSAGALKRSVMMELRPATEFGWQAGDTIGFLPPNPSSLVEKLLKDWEMDGTELLKCSSDSANAGKFALERSISVREMLQWHMSMLDPSAVSPATLLTLSQFAADEWEAHALRWLGSSSGDFAEHFAPLKLTVMDLLVDAFPSLRVPLGVLLSVCPHTRPRWYSVASSHIGELSNIRILFSEVEFCRCLQCRALNDRPGAVDCRNCGGKLPEETPRQKGACTGFLAGLPDSSALIALWRQSTFRLPECVTERRHPIIMVCAGSGLAPFLGFLGQLEGCKPAETAEAKMVSSEAPLEWLQPFWRGNAALVSVARSGSIVTLQSSSSGALRTWLVFGARHPVRDSLGLKQLMALLQAGVLGRLTLCFSRLCEDKAYVQHGLEEWHEEVGRWVAEERARVRVCGDAAGMAKSVRAALLASLRPGKTEDEAEETLKELLQMDVWT